MSRNAMLKTHMVSVPRPRPNWTAHEQMEGVECDPDRGGAPMTVSSAMAKFTARRCPGSASGSPASARSSRAWMRRPTSQVWEKLFALTSPGPGRIEGRDGLPPPARAPSAAAVPGRDGGHRLRALGHQGQGGRLPVFRLLGGTRTDVFTYAVGGMYSETGSMLDCADELAGFVRQGFRAVKLKSGALSLKDEVARVKAVRRRPSGPTSCSNARLQRGLRCAGGDRVRPCRGAVRHLLVRGAAALVLAAGGFRPAGAGHPDPAGARRTRADPLLGARLHRFRRAPLYPVRLARFGGFTEGLRVASLRRAARGHGGAAHRAEIPAHIVLAQPRGAFGVESHGGPEHDPLAYGLFHNHPQLRDGHLEIGGAPGFGLEIDWDFVEKHRAD